MEEQYTKDFLVADFTNQIKVTEENIVKLREEIARQTQQLVRLNGAVDQRFSASFSLSMVKDAPSATEEEAEETLDEILEETEVEDAE